MGKISTKETDKSLPRQAWPEISYASKKANKTLSSGTIRKYIESFTFTDAAQGESDTVDLTLCNVDMAWASKWLPQKEDILYASIVTQNWDKAGVKNIIECGKFCCDDRNFTFPEAGTASISGVSVPETNAFRATQRNKTWQNITMWEIANTIAKRYWMQLSYNAPAIRVTKAEQSDADDCSFLNSLCNDYGLYMKVYRGKIAIYDVAAFEKKASVATISYKDIVDGDYSSTLTGTYTGAKIKYTSGTTEKTLVIGWNKRLLNISEKADTYAEADRKARAKLRAENRKAETLKITLVSGKQLWASSVITIKDAAAISGRWFIDKVTHTVSAGDGYSAQLELHRVK